MKKILIIGANFYNKGAQSMLFTTIDKLRKMYKNCDIYFASWEQEKINNYKFEKIMYVDYLKKILLSNKKEYFYKIKHIIKNCVKLIIGKNTSFGDIKKLEKLFNSLDLIIDISGFSLGDKWSNDVQESYLDNIRLAKKYSIPMVLMPQSFGPFENENQDLLEEIKDLLKYPKLIFAREREGYIDLKEKFKLNNVMLSTDLVLQTDEINLKNIFINEKDISISVPKVQNENSVAVVPNVRCFEHGNKNSIIELYREIINKLLELEKKVYIFKHSSDDLEACVCIKKLFTDNDNVILIERDFNCIEYNEFVKQFDFIICSRYHGVVHAYKNLVPTIVLGWATKYKELTTNLGQYKYCFDITLKDINISDITNKIDEMNKNIFIEKEVIKNKLEMIQNDNCFEYLKKIDNFNKE